MSKPCRTDSRQDDDALRIETDLPPMMSVTDDEIDLIATHLSDIIAEMLNETD